MRPTMTLAVVGLLALGCSDRSHAGHYAGKRQVEGPIHIAGTLAKVDLNLHRDGTFDLMNTSLSYTGEWNFSDGKIVLTIKTALGRPIFLKDQPYLIPKDGGLEFNDPHGTDPRPVLLAGK